uniref:Uncharacterized protein n=1 Tax=Fervidicoccus fontis TaxID=683846 RepID=A0A7C1E144_9CREN
MSTEIVKTIDDSLIIYEGKEHKHVLTYYLPGEPSYVEFGLDYAEKRLAIKLIGTGPGNEETEDEVEFTLGFPQLEKLKSIIDEVLDGKKSIAELLSLVYNMKKLKEDYGFDDAKAFELSLAINYIEKGLSPEKAFMITEPTIVSPKDIIDCPLYMYTVVKARSKKNADVFAY